MHGPKSEIRNPKSRIQLVVFDLGGVLIRLASSWRDAFEHAGVAYPAAMDEEPTRTRLRELVHLEEPGKLGVYGFFEQAGPLVGITPEQLVQVSDAYLRGAFPGVETLLDDLAAAPVQTACLSNTNHNHWKDLANPDHPNGLPLQLLDYRFASQLIGHRKPDAGIYQHLEENTGIEPNNILFFDDRQDNIQAAALRGWNTHRVEHPTDTVPEIRSVLQQYNVPLAT
ncbi:MAG: HAD-IA family hydrolase [Planctomycetota bacterium]